MRTCVYLYPVLYWPLEPTLAAVLTPSFWSSPSCVLKSLWLLSLANFRLPLTLSCLFLLSSEILSSIQDQNSPYWKGVFMNMHISSHQHSETLLLNHTPSHTYCFACFFKAETFLPFQKLGFAQHFCVWQFLVVYYIYIHYIYVYIQSCSILEGPPYFDLIRFLQQDVNVEEIQASLPDTCV